MTFLLVSRLVSMLRGSCCSTPRMHGECSLFTFPRSRVRSAPPAVAIGGCATWRSAYAAASVRLRSPSFIRMLLTWLPAVFVLMNSLVGDLGVGQALSDQPQHLLLAPREHADVTRAGAAPDTESAEERRDAVGLGRRSHPVECLERASGLGHGQAAIPTRAVRAPGRLASFRPRARRLPWRSRRTRTSAASAAALALVGEVDLPEGLVAERRMQPRAGDGRQSPRSRAAEDAASSTSPRSRAASTSRTSSGRPQDRSCRRIHPSAIAQAMHRAGAGRPRARSSAARRGDAVGVVLEPGEEGLRLRQSPLQHAQLDEVAPPDAGSGVGGRWSVKLRDRSLEFLLGSVEATDHEVDPTAASGAERGDEVEWPTRSRTEATARTRTDDR